MEYLLIGLVVVVTVLFFIKRNDEKTASELQPKVKEKAAKPVKKAPEKAPAKKARAKKTTATPLKVLK